MRLSGELSLVVPELVIGQDLHDIVGVVVPGLLAVLEGISGVLEHRHHVLLGAQVEEVANLLGDVVSGQNWSQDRVGRGSTS